MSSFMPAKKGDGGATGGSSPMGGMKMCKEREEDEKVSSSKSLNEPMVVMIAWIEYFW